MPDYIIPNNERTPGDKNMFLHRDNMNLNNIGVLVKIETKCTLMLNIMNRQLIFLGNLSRKKGLENFILTLQIRQGGQRKATHNQRGEIV